MSTSTNSINVAKPTAMAALPIWAILLRNGMWYWRRTQKH